MRPLWGETYSVPKHLLRGSQTYHQGTAWNRTLIWPPSLSHSTIGFSWEHFLISHFYENLQLWACFWGTWLNIPPNLSAWPPSFTIWAWWPCLWVIPGDRGAPKPSPGCKFCRAGMVPFWAQERPWHIWVIEWMRALPNSAFLFVTSLFISF